MLLMTPGPTDLHPRVLAAMNRPMIDHRSQAFNELMRGVEEKCMKVFETGRDVYVLTCSGTGGVECAVSNVIERGDKVLVPVFGDFCSRLADACEAYGGEVERTEHSLGHGPTPVSVKEFLDNHPDTKVLALVYNETSTGVLVRDLRGIIRECRRYGVLVIVDAITALGGVKMPVDELDIDVCITSSQKCLAAPPGLSLISFSEAAYEKALRKEKRPPYFDVAKLRAFLREKGETPFTPALPLLYALDESLNIILETGLDKWISRHQAGAAAMYKGFAELGLRFIAERDFRSPTVLTMSPPAGLGELVIKETMRERFHVQIAGGLGKYRGKMLRVANVGNVSPHRVLSTVDAMGRTLEILSNNGKREEALAAVRHILSETWPG